MLVKYHCGKRNNYLILFIVYISPQKCVHCVECTKRHYIVLVVLLVWHAQTLAYLTMLVIVQPEKATWKSNIMSFGRNDNSKLKPRSLVFTLYDVYSSSIL